MTFTLWRDRILLVLLAILPWQGRFLKEPAAIDGIPWEQGTVALFILELLLLTALVCHMLSAAGQCEPKKAAPPIWFQAGALLLLFALVSVFWGFDTLAGLFTWFHLFDGFALAYLIWVSRLPLRNVAAAFLVGAVLASVLGLWQFFSQSSTASTLFGVARHAAAEPGTAVVETEAGRFLRAYGPLPHPNVFGGYMAAGFLAALALYLGAASRRASRMIYAAGLLVFAGLIVSFSRSAWIAAAAAVTLARWGGRKPLPPEAVSRFRKLAAGALIVLALLLAWSWPLFAARLGAHGRLEKKSIDERSASIFQGLELFKTHYAFGTGIGNMAPAAYMELEHFSEEDVAQPAHMVPVLIAAELGFFGLAVLIGAAIAWLMDFLVLLKISSSPLVRFAAAAPFIVIVVGLFDHYPVSIFAGTMLSGCLFGLYLKATDAA